ncbi:MAG: hypothetical protein ACR2IE_03670, partial [Candidatus Sumerlaeaceae bacterium]
HPPAPPTDDYSYMSTPTLEMFHAPYVQVRVLQYRFFKGKGYALSRQRCRALYASRGHSAVKSGVYFW